MRPSLTWLLSVVLSFVAPVVAQDDAARLDAVKEFQRFFRKEKSEALQVEAILTHLKGNECVPAAEELIKLLKHPSAAVQQAAMTVLATYNDPKTYATWIAELPKSKDPEQQAVIVKVLGAAKVKDAAPAIETVGLEPKASPVLKYECARALHGIGDGGAKGLLGALLADKEPQVRIAALDAVAALRRAEHAKAATALLGAPEWQVQAAAIAACGQLRPQEAIQPLIDLMRKEGRMRVECADALFRVTGLDFGVDPDQWQRQYDLVKGIAGWRIPTDAELAKRAESRRKADEYYGKKEDRKEFARIPTTSTNILFVIDVSGSMDDLVAEVDKFQGYADRRKFTVVQAELLSAIDSLTPETNFEILAFATDIHPWKKRLVPANVVNKDAAKQHVKSLRPIGGTEDQNTALSGLTGAANLEAGKTNTLKALMHAFGVDPDKPAKAAVAGFDKNAIKSPLDTVYFLSDGRPSVGKIIEPLEILKEVRRHNEAFRMVIHTIAIGDFTKDFLEKLAGENGGVFVDLGR